MMLIDETVEVDPKTIDDLRDEDGSYEDAVRSLCTAVGLLVVKRGCHYYVALRDHPGQRGVALVCDCEIDEMRDRKVDVEVFGQAMALRAFSLGQFLRALYMTDPPEAEADQSPRVARAHRQMH